MKSIYLLIGLVCLTLFSLAQSPSNGIQYQTQWKSINDSIATVTLQLRLPAGVELLSLITKEDPDALHSQLVQQGKAFSIDSLMTVSPQSVSKQDAALGQAVDLHQDSVQWILSIKRLIKDSTIWKANLLAFTKKGDAFETTTLALTEDFPAHNAETISANTAPTETTSLGWIFITAFGGGLLALITPCVYSMIPVTVSFFTKRSPSRAVGIRNATIYAISIIAIFTLLGFLVTAIFGPAALNNLATNWIANLVFFAVFAVFGISFLGAFEINLPSSWGNKVDSKAGGSSIIGIFFMALTLVVVSFSCTGPIIGNLIVLAAKGSFYGPLVGMFAFSLALALPFFLFALFPSWLNVLGKSGGWLNAVKVTLGFLELALALKFLSNADLARGWRLLDREIFIAIWIVLFILLGMYLLGKLKFHHDDELPKNDFGWSYISIPRLFFAIASFSIAVYMVPGMWGAPLKGLSAFVPPMGTQDFILNNQEGGNAPLSSTNSTNSEYLPKKYAKQMHIYEPEVVKKYGMITYFDYDEALAASKALKKPVMIDFTGINCVNCRKMEAEVWSDPAVMKLLKEEFIIASLYVDVDNDNVRLPKDEQYISSLKGQKVTTLGDKNEDFQISQFNSNAQPFYFFVDGDGKRLVPDGYGYNPDVPAFLAHLEKVLAAYRQ